MAREGGAAGEDEEFEHLVEGGGIRGAVGGHGHEGRQVAEGLGCESSLARGHPVPVAANGVDLAVVGDHAEGLGEVPGGEGVRREARVDEGEAGGHGLIAQIGEEVGELVRREHPLVDHGRGRQARHVDPVLALGAAPEAEGRDVERASVPLGVRVGDDELTEGRQRSSGGRADGAVLDGHVAPCERSEALLPRDAFDGGDRLGEFDAPVGRSGEEDEAGGVGAGCGQVGSDRLFEEGVGHLDEDARPVAGVLLGADGSAVVEALEGGEAGLDDRVRGGPLSAATKARPQASCSFAGS